MIELRLSPKAAKALAMLLWCYVPEGDRESTPLTRELDAIDNALVDIGIAPTAAEAEDAIQNFWDTEVTFIDPEEE